MFSSRSTFILTIFLNYTPYSLWRIFHFYRSMQSFSGIRYVCFTLLAQAIKLSISLSYRSSLRWNCNGRDDVSNHQPRYCLLNRLFGHRSKKTPKFRVTCFCATIHRWPVNSPHKWPVTRKMLSFDYVIIVEHISILTTHRVVIWFGLVMCIGDRFTNMV